MAAANVVNDVSPIWPTARARRRPSRRSGSLGETAARGRVSGETRFGSAGVSPSRTATKHLSLDEKMTTQGLAEFSQVPLIDVGPLVSGDAPHSCVAEQLGRACR